MAYLKSVEIIETQLILPANLDIKGLEHFINGIDFTSRKRENYYPRLILIQAMYNEFWEAENLTLAFMAAVFKKDHTTILHALKVISMYVGHDDFERSLNELQLQMNEFIVQTTKQIGEIESLITLENSIFVTRPDYAA